MFSLLTVPMSINIIAKNSNHVYIRLGQITRDYDFFLKSAYFLKAMAKAQAMQKLWNEKKNTYHCSQCLVK